MANMAGTGFVRGLVGTSTQLWQLKQVAERERARQDLEQQQLKLLQQRAKGDAARLTLAEQGFQLTLRKTMEDLATQRQVQQQIQGAFAPEAADAPGDVPAGAAPAEPAGAPGAAALWQHELDRLQRTAAGLQQRITRLLPTAFTEEGKRLVGALQAEHTRALGEVNRLRSLTKPGSATRPGLAARAAAGDETAQRALDLIRERGSGTTLVQLAARAAAGDEAAIAALELLRELRQTGVQGERPRKGKAKPEPVPLAPQVDPTFKGRLFEGRGEGVDPDLPKVRSFRRVD